MKRRYIRLLLAAITASMALPFSRAQEAEPAHDQAPVEPVSETSDKVAEAPKSTKTEETADKKPEKYDLSALPPELRAKVEDYLKQEAALEKEIQRLDSMVKASSNAWAQQRATGMATKLNYELKNQRLKRREIIRDYRELLRSGWEPPGSMGDFESLFYSRGEGESSS